MTLLTGMSIIASNGYVLQQTIHINIADIEIKVIKIKGGISS
ncbi:MAG: hypothetical protein ACTS77_00210 [Arsenophonus sp. NC-TX2-MAG3]